MADHLFDDLDAAATDPGQAPLIVSLGSAVALTGKQPRGDKADGGAAGGDYQYHSESPRE
ncbi:MAG: hypothetical protein H7X93_04785 [Sphingomonadaceae bacterium]|nr:hypothetical protein [Sphingomonadaceae bacterium]